MPDQDIVGILKLIWPLIILQIGVAAWTIADILKRKRTRSLTPAVWIIITLIFNLIGPVAYFLYGRAED